MQKPGSRRLLWKMQFSCSARGVQLTSGEASRMSRIGKLLGLRGRRHNGSHLMHGTMVHTIKAVGEEVLGSNRLHIDLSLL
ncbi:hypothetical protein EYF80_005719 [Liparis tanakae]|uniref:Uncharacterized protein n=1 Tax=Liparis tanakae TaxID=230148 RepID=A0A4Z2J3N1_9TELE|nr:hypothetical protein EYF80_005719 [Liparis tanakae]